MLHRKISSLLFIFISINKNNILNSKNNIKEHIQLFQKKKL